MIRAGDIFYPPHFPQNFEDSLGVDSLHVPHTAGSAAPIPAMSAAPAHPPPILLSRPLASIPPSTSIQYRMPLISPKNAISNQEDIAKSGGLTLPPLWDVVGRHVGEDAQWDRERYRKRRRNSSGDERERSDDMDGASTSKRIDAARRGSTASSSSVPYERIRESNIRGGDYEKSQRD